MTIKAKGRINLDVQLVQQIQSAVAGGAPFGQIAESIELSNGTSDGNVDKVYWATTSAVAASATTLYDLAGSLLDAEGATITFAEVVLIVVRNKRTTALAYLLVGADATNGFGQLGSSLGFWGATANITNGGGNVVAPSSFILLYDKQGVPVSAGSTDELAVVTSGVSGSSNSWDILIAGRAS